MEKLLKQKIEDKINEAENCEDTDVSEEYLKGYKNGLKMALLLINDSKAEDYVEIHIDNDIEYTIREKAKKFYLDCFYMSEGAERERYANILAGLDSGKKIIYG